MTCAGVSVRRMASQCSVSNQAGGRMCRTGLPTAGSMPRLYPSCHFMVENLPSPLTIGHGTANHPPMKLTWKDHEEIAWALMDNFPDQDPLKLSFPKLHAMVCA